MAAGKQRSISTNLSFPTGNGAGVLSELGSCLKCIALAIVVILPMLMPQKFEAVQNYWVIPGCARILRPGSLSRRRKPLS